jgi:hypothetical protein
MKQILAFPEPILLSDGTILKTTRDVIAYARRNRSDSRLKEMRVRMETAEISHMAQVRDWARQAAVRYFATTGQLVEETETFLLGDPAAAPLGA